MDISPCLGASCEEQGHRAGNSIYQECEQSCCPVTSGDPANFRNISCKLITCSTLKRSVVLFECLNIDRELY